MYPFSTTTPLRGFLSFCVFLRFFKAGGAFALWAAAGFRGRTRLRGTKKTYPKSARCLSDKSRHFMQSRGGAPKCVDRAALCADYSLNRLYDLTTEMPGLSRKIQNSLDRGGGLRYSISVLIHIVQIIRRKEAAIRRKVPAAHVRDAAGRRAPEGGNAGADIARRCG